MMENKSCVAYMRYSTDNQTENSIEYQRAAIAAHCISENQVLVEEFIDEAYSASSDRRPSFQRMIEASKNNPVWDKIVVYDSSRIFRNSADASRYREELNGRGIKIISVKEKFPSSAIGWFMTAFTDVINAYYVHQTREKTISGMTNKARKGLHCGGTPPLGYDIDPQTEKYVLYEEEVDTVRKIFRMYVAGYSYEKMAKELNRKGLKTKSGRKFTKNSFYAILTQEKYIGIFRWNKRKAKDSKGHHNNHAYKPEDEQIVIPGGCPAIIPLEQFQKVQEKLLERRKGKADTKSRHHYMFSGLKIMKCANCGEYMVGKVTQSHGRKYISYACPRHRGGGCPTKDIPATNLELYVCACIVGNLITEGTISSLNILAVENKPETEQINSRLISVDKKIDNIVKNLKQMESSRLRDELSQLELKKSDLERQKRDAETAVPVITAKNLKQLKKGLFEIFKANSSALNGKTTKSRRNALEVREALQTYVQEILVSNDDVKITLQL